MLLKIVLTLAKIVAAVIFGVAFWWFLSYMQPDFVDYRFSCCMRCGNILFEREQPVLAVCAGLALLVLSFIKTKGWQAFIVTVVISFLCFFPYWLFTYWTGHPRQECTALNYPRGALPFMNEIAMAAISGYWASFCLATLLVLQAIRVAIIWVMEE